MIPRRRLGKISVFNDKSAKTLSHPLLLGILSRATDVFRITNQELLSAFLPACLHRRRARFDLWLWSRGPILPVQKLFKAQQAHRARRPFFPFPLRLLNLQTERDQFLLHAQRYGDRADLFQLHFSIFPGNWPKFKRIQPYAFSKCWKSDLFRFWTVHNT